MVKEAIDVYIQGELWPKAKRCAAEMAPKWVNWFSLFVFIRPSTIEFYVLIVLFHLVNDDFHYLRFYCFMGEFL